MSAFSGRIGALVLLRLNRVCPFDGRAQPDQKHIEEDLCWV